MQRYLIIRFRLRYQARTCTLAQIHPAMKPTRALVIVECGEYCLDFDDENEGEYM